MCGGAVVAVIGLGLIAAPVSSDSKVSEPVPVTPVLSARRLPEVLLGGVADPKYTATLDSYFAKASGRACAVVMQGGRVLYTRSAAETFAPASTIKLLTALAAVDLLGADTRLTTRLVAATEPIDGVVLGDLTIIGSGNPLFVTNGYKQSLEDPDQVTQDFGEVADALVVAGIREITGSIIGDESRLDRTRWIPSWPSRYQIGGVVGPLSALMVNDGQTGFVDEPDRPNAERKPGDAASLAAATLRTLLVDRGIRVGGTSGSGRAPEDAHEVASSDSLPINEIVGEMLTDSDNTTAELLTRLIGLEESGTGTTAAGLDAIRSFLTARDLSVDDLVMVDGSGLDTTNRVSCALLLDVLSRLPAESPIIAKLAVAGRTGTLRKRLLDSPATAKVRAKTGTLSSVNALAGFADPKAGSELTFVMIQNGSDPRGVGFTDGFAERVVLFGEGRRLDPLLPAPPR
jgi:D-alanyl-D-alanine carboxypeptidase/D-alanyl-D-alanine-endopeptidase (penicillin-binding protein 4)